MRTFNGWGKVSEAGWLEIDLVAHCGKRMEGRFLWTLVATDIATGWSDCLPLHSRDWNLGDGGAAAAGGAAAVPAARDRRGQRQCLYERPAGELVREVPAPDRSDLFTGLPEKRPGLVRAEDRDADPPGDRLPAAGRYGVC